MYFRTFLLHGLIVAMALFPIRPAHAWGAKAHQAIAMAAERMLVPQAKAGVGRLLALEPRSTLSSVSTWADEHRNPVSARWHYINFPTDTCVYVPQRDCLDGACVIEAIQRQTAILRSKASDAERLNALRYIVHLVGDVHQPLHAGFAADRGGNDYQVQAFGRGSNVHGFWDTGIVESIDTDVDRLTQLIAATNLHDLLQPPENVVQQAAVESCQLVREDWFYPSRKPSETYQRRAKEVALERMSQAARRLATLLNSVLG